MNRLINFIMVLCLVAGATLITPAGAVRASGTTWTVNTLVDENDGSCAGNCSLREAVWLAQSGDTINFASGGLMKLTLGEIVINKSINIVGPGVGYGGLIISANDASHHFKIESGTVSISGMLLNHGKDINGASIYNLASLYLDAMVISFNKSQGYGAVYNDGILSIKNSIVSDNTSDAGWFGGIFNEQDAHLSLDNVKLERNEAPIYAGGDVSIINSTLNANSGIGIYAVDSTYLDIQNSSINGGVNGNAVIVYGATSANFINTKIQGNSSLGGGGGVLFFLVSHAEIRNSVISGNLVTTNTLAPDYGGGGVAIRASTVLIENSTISGNNSPYAGGGLYVDADSLLQMKNVTVANNTAGMGGGIYVPSGNNTVTMKNSILADNTSLNMSFNDCYAEVSSDVASQGSNLVESGNCIFSTPSDIVGQDPLLNGLVDNGGPTQTHSLKPNSPAIDKGNDITCSATDQRGIMRPIGSHCDIGAYEYVPAWADQLWAGGVSVTSDKQVVAVGRPHIGNEIASYDGFTKGSTTVYVPMLFKDAFGGSYDSALYIQNVSTNIAGSITLNFFDSNGVLNCTKSDTLAPLASRGYWLPSMTCDSGSLPVGWTGGVKVDAGFPIVAVGRPHIGSEVMTYNGFASGSLNTYIPMLFKGAFGGSYNAAFYIQNVHATNTAAITIKYYDSNGVLNCTKADTIAPLASKGYWVPSATCDSGSLPAGWSGGVVVSSNQPIVGVGRPHIGTQITTYDGFAAGSMATSVPMLFKGAFGGSYNAAFYVQNVHAANTANITIKYYDNNGNLNCTKTDTLAPLASKGYWVPSATCDSGALPAGWSGGVVVTSDQPIVGVGRPHIGTQVTTYNGFASASVNAYVPMLFKNAYGGSYNAAFYVQNLENSTASVTLNFYDSNGNLSCVRTDTIPARATLGIWIPTVTCDP